MISPQETEVASSGGKIKARCRIPANTNNAIGYTFRYYATQMNADKNIKLLAINGIAPTARKYSQWQISLCRRCIYGNAGQYDVRNTKTG